MLVPITAASLMSPPLFDWLQQRQAGVLLHPTSLPGDGGVGTLGPEAFRWVDFLAEAGLRAWQFCPLGPTGFGDSPYQSFSAFAGNPYLIDLDALGPFGLIKPDDLTPLRSMAPEWVDFGALYQRKWPILLRAFRRFQAMDLAYLPNYGLYADFKRNHSAWLDPFVLFMALKQHHDGRAAADWPAPYRSYATAAASPLPQSVLDTAESHRFFQYLFFGQWQLLREHAARRGVTLIGDLPIFVALDSADVWAQPGLFQLDRKGRPTHVAGVPPDYFSKTGQLWGNPLFDWKAHQADGYAWWLQRLAANFALYDVVRIDHFRGFETYWKIPAAAEDARSGSWAKGPALDFFKAVHDRFPDARLIAEDLGEITPAVRQLREATGLPGMAILHFAFGGDAENAYLPHNLSPNLVLYPGTHDNNTTLGWYRDAPEAVRDHTRRYLRVSGHEISWDLIRAAYASVSRLVVFPLQDLLSLGPEARFNTPGVPAGNWQWRYRRDQLESLRGNTASYLRDLATLYGR